MHGARRAKAGAVHELPHIILISEAPELPALFHGPRHLADWRLDADDCGHLARLALLSHSALLLGLAGALYLAGRRSIRGLVHPICVRQEIVPELADDPPSAGGIFP
jgi:hypothetical protein